MSRRELYPWSMMTEVGDYFIVPHTLKPNSYIKSLVAVRNANSKGINKFVCCELFDSTIVILAQVLNEKPPYEFETDAGIMVCTSRRSIIDSTRSIDGPSIGVRPVIAERTQAQKVDAMSHEERLANLPWWYDKKTGNLVVNPELVKEKEAQLWMAGKFNPGPNTPYPKEYGLDSNLMKKSREQLMEEEDEFDEASLWEGMDVTGESEDDGNDE